MSERTKDMLTLSLRRTSWKSGSSLVCVTILPTVRGAFLHDGNDAKNANVNIINNLSFILMQSVTYSETNVVCPAEVCSQCGGGENMPADVLHHPEFLVNTTFAHLLAGNVPADVENE